MTNKIIVWMQSSLDGYSAGPNGEFDWAQIGDEIHSHFVTTLRDAGLFVYGHTVFGGSQTVAGLRCARERVAS